MIPRNLKTVETWYKMPTITSDTVRTLEKVFQNATTRGNNSYFFGDIWIPLKDRGSNHEMLDTVTYTNVGITTEQMAQIYRTLYGRNLLSVPLINWEDDPLKYAASVDELSIKMKSILNLNLYKYLKWIDSMGYAYNPLWNVDGTEEYQWIDNHGDIVRDNVPILPFGSHLKTASYDDDEKDTSSTYNAYGGINKNGDTEQYTISDGSANTVSELRSRDTETHEDITGQTPQEIEGPIIAITGGDFSHIEKRIRQGNIGVTQTSELIRNERELVKFNLVQEFFRDINKQLLVGTYDGF